MKIETTVIKVVVIEANLPEMEAVQIADRLTSQCKHSPEARCIYHEFATALTKGL